jgi:hypothetical protein
MAKYFTKQVLLFTALLSIVLSFSCAKKEQIFYLLSLDSEVRKTELRDHEICLKLKLNTDDKSNLNSKYYWQCRLAFARYRISPNAQTALQNAQNAKFIDLAAKINLKISQTNENFLLSETRKLDDKQHKQCLSLGFVFETDDSAKIDEYFFCRRALIEEYESVAPFGRQDLLQYHNENYNLNFALNQRIKANIAKSQKLEEEYPTCMNYNIYSKNFARCAKAQDESRTCYREVNAKIFKKEWQRKIKCQKEAYTKYSDEMLEMPENLSEIESKKRNQNSDFINNNNMAALGVSEKHFVSKEELEKFQKQQKENEENEKAKKINSKLGLYQKHELAKLRQKYIFACQSNSNIEIEKFAKELENQCEKLKEFEVLGN